jgi:hypothetical protein
MLTLLSLAAALADEPAVHFKPTAYFYFRPETATNRRDLDFGAKDSELNFNLRGDFGGRLSLPKHVDVVANLQSFGTYTLDKGALDDTVRLYEAYVEMKEMGNFELAFGRKTLGNYGKRLIMANREFGSGLSFETIRARYETDVLTHDWMWAQLYQTGSSEDGEEIRNLHPVWAGNYNTIRLSEAFNLDAYAFVLAAMSLRDYNMWIAIPGLRPHGWVGDVDYSVEGVLQAGAGKQHFGDAKASMLAYATSAEVGYSFGGGAQPRVFVRYYRGSGDSDPTDDSINSLFRMWPYHHSRFGNMDMFTGPNLQAQTLGVEATAGTWLFLGANASAAQAVAVEDASLGLLAPDVVLDPNARSSLGFGADLWFKAKYSDHLSFELNGSTWVPGGYQQDNTGESDPMIRVYLHGVARY